MLKTGILNPDVLSLLARVRHTNLLVIADRGFPSWNGVETIDLSLVDDLPRVEQVLAAILPHWKAGRVFMAEEFRKANSAKTVKRFETALQAVEYLPHVELKLKVPGAVGLIRTGDTTQYANVILESA
jgi:D-ribose pyranase